MNRPARHGDARDAIHLANPAEEVDRITRHLRNAAKEHKRRGFVVALSGGIDSSVVAALVSNAVGPERVLAVLMPEIDSASDTVPLAERVARHLDLPAVLEDVTPLLATAGCYARRDEAIRSAIPDYGEGWAAKLVLPDPTRSDTYALSSLVARDPAGREHRVRLDPDAYRQVVAATSFKQRVRAMLSYFHADRMHYLVAGTPNRLEYELGFFVKNGDGAADVKPIAHLFKTQVYDLAAHLGLPRDVRSRVPTTDTYALPQRQDEFYFPLPHEGMDLCLHALDEGLPARALCDVLGLEERQVQRVFDDIEAKRRVATYLHATPTLLSPTSPRTEEGEAVLDLAAS